MINPGSIHCRTETFPPPRLTKMRAVVITEHKVVGADTYRCSLKPGELVDGSRGEGNQPVMVLLRRPNLVSAFPRLAHCEHLPLEVDVTPSQRQNLSPTKTGYCCQVEAGVIMNVSPGAVYNIWKECPEFLSGEDTAFLPVLLYPANTCGWVAVNLFSV